MSKREPLNIDGCDFWDWHVIKELPCDPVFPGRRRWLCRCSCGNTKPVQASSLLYGGSKSCGHESRIRRGRKNNKFKHGMAHKNIWNRWWSMTRRCHDLNSGSYRNYGARGIQVCERWHSFENFYADMGDPPFKEACLERINNNGNYCPENVRWASRKEQMRNTRSSRFIVANNERRSAAEWEELTKIPSYLIRQRIDRQGWTPDEALGFKERTKF